ncbi:hypothetical protein OG871_40300 (plasmid) [Kitasatospora sp. NBC_00374]|uniref:hypothetical protein n=1 Tax=Kitasatospora sp. NBC_00374 TaxID=2975964 RepID=UPI002F910982
MTDFLTQLSTGADGLLSCNGLDYIEFDVRIARDPSCPSASKAAYMALAAFADMELHITLTAESVAGWSTEVRSAMLPYRKTIAACMGRSANTFDRAVVDLVGRDFLLVQPQQNPDHPGAPDANLYRLTDRERWARQVLERASNPTPPTPLLGADGRPVPRVLRTPGIDFIKLDARIACFGGRSPNYKAVYAAVASFVNLNSRAITERPPTIRELMACTGLGRTAVTDALAQMRADGLLVTRDQYAPDHEGGGRLASSYALLDGRLWRARAAAREDREIAQFIGGSTHQPDGGLPTTRTGVYPSAGQGSPHQPDISNRSSENRGGELLPDARRASSGGKAREPRAARAAKPAGKGGSAADRTKKTRTTTIRTAPSRPVPGEEIVFAAIDALGVSKHPALRVPPLRRAVRDLLSAGRTTEHALARINAGWWRAGAPERVASGEIRGPVGYLATVLSGQDCERPDCERGLILGSGEECQACGLRAAEREADRARRHLEAQTAAAAGSGGRSGKRPSAGSADRSHNAKATWRCEAPGPGGFGTGVCGRPGLGTPPPLPMCPDCLDDLQRALGR